MKMCIKIEVSIHCLSPYRLHYSFAVALEQTPRWQRSLDRLLFSFFVLFDDMFIQILQKQQKLEEFAFI